MGLRDASASNNDYTCIFWFFLWPKNNDIWQKSQLGLPWTTLNLQLIQLPDRNCHKSPENEKTCVKAIPSLIYILVPSQMFWDLKLFELGSRMACLHHGQAAHIQGDVSKGSPPWNLTFGFHPQWGFLIFILIKKTHMVRSSDVPRPMYTLSTWAPVNPSLGKIIEKGASLLK